ncbi:MAG: class I SAM-dependent methyltransferase [Propylenella sp.]
MSARRLRLGLLTLFGLRKRGFFIPYRYADQVPERADRVGYPALEPFFAAAEPTFSAMLEAMAPFADDLHRIGGAPPPEPRWNQDWFPRLDAAAAYVFVRESKPARIVEVGSGHSTRFVMRAIRDGGLQTEVIAIDPAPRADIEGFGATLIRGTVQAAGLAPFSALAEGDILFIDSSHILMPGTDVDLLMNQVLPMLERRVMIHVHDVFLPDDYPPEWQWRGYNEQLGVAALVQGRGYRILWSSRYAATRMADAVAKSVAGELELKAGALESSLWLVKT